MRNYVKHGESRTALYRKWMAIRTRCNNKHFQQYADYGGRGITVCKEWMDFANFSTWAKKNGYRDGLEIDRIDVDGDYCPENCRFVSHKDNMRNQHKTVRIEHNGTLYTLPEICEINGLPYNTVYNRYAKGWKTQDIIHKPVVHPDYNHNR